MGVIADVLQHEHAVVGSNLEDFSENVAMQNASSTFQDDFLNVLLSSVSASTCQVPTAASLSPKPNKEQMEEFDYSFLQQEMGPWVPLDTLDGFTGPQEELMAPQPITPLPHANSGNSEGAGSSDCPGKSLSRPSASVGRKGVSESHKRAQKKYREKQKARLEQAERQLAVATQQLEQMRLEQRRLEARNQLLEKVAALSQSQRSQQITGEDYLCSKTRLVLTKGWGLFGESITLTVHDAPETYTLTEIRHMSKVRFTSLWKEYVNQLASLLLNITDDRDSPAYKRMHQLDIELCSLYAIVATGTAEDIRWLQSTRLEETSYSTGTPDAEFWTNVQRSMDFSPEQKRDAVILRQAYLAKVGLVKHRRKQLIEQLKDALPQGTSQSSMRHKYVEASCAMQKLQSNVAEEHRCFLQLAAASVQGIRTTKQSAISFVSAYPFCSDGLHMLNVLAQQAGYPSADIVMDQPRTAEEWEQVETDWAAIAAYVDSINPEHLDRHQSLFDHMVAYQRAQQGAMSPQGKA